MAGGRPRGSPTRSATAIVAETAAQCPDCGSTGRLVCRLVRRDELSTVITQTQYTVRRYAVRRRVRCVDCGRLYTLVRYELTSRK